MEAAMETVIEFLSLSLSGFGTLYAWARQLFGWQ